MMQILSLLVAIIAIIAALAGGFLAFSAFLVADATVKLGFTTAIISVAALIYNNSRQQTREIKARQFSDKRAAYQKFFDFMFALFHAQRSGIELTEQDIIEKMGEIVKDVMVWGSAETINEYNAFLRASLSADINNPKNLFCNTESLMRAFRKDLGHNDSKLEKLALTKLILKADEHNQLDDL